MTGVLGQLTLSGGPFGVTCLEPVGPERMVTLTVRLNLIVEVLFCFQGVAPSGSEWSLVVPNGF